MSHARAATTLHALRPYARRSYRLGRRRHRDSAADDLELAAALVREAGRLAAAMLADGLTTQHKTSISDVVSAADHAAEELVVITAARRATRTTGWSARRAPNDPAPRTWFVDPVDGTYNFLSGLPLWCSAVALARRRRRCVLGAVYQPATDELWLGGRDDPTTLQRRPGRAAGRPAARRGVDRELPASRARCPTRRPRVPLLRAMQGAATVRMLGSGSVELAVGRRPAGSVRRCSSNSQDWDWLPGAALVRAPVARRRCSTRTVTAGTPPASRQTVDELRRPGAGRGSTAGLTASGLQRRCRPSAARRRQLLVKLARAAARCASTRCSIVAAKRARGRASSTNDSGHRQHHGDHRRRTARAVRRGRAGPTARGTARTAARCRATSTPSRL